MSTATFPTITAGAWRMAMIRARSTANEVAQEIRARLAPRMLRRCAWCKMWLPSVPCDRSMHGTVSDGMCLPCAGKYFSSFTVGSGTNNETQSVEGRSEPLPAGSLGVSETVSAAGGNAADTSRLLGDATTVRKATERSLAACENKAGAFSRE